MSTLAARPAHPPVALTAEIRWVLLRAFAPSQAAAPAHVQGAEVAALARDLGLVERIGARVPGGRLASELGRDVARELAVSRLQVLAGVNRLCHLIPELAAAAAEASVPLVFLKFAGLYVGGYLAEGSRAAADIDVLVPERDVARATQMLTARGFFESTTTLADHHHAPPLHDREGRVVELHTRLPGLRAPGQRRFAGYDTLRAAGGLEPAPGLGPGCHVLRRDLLAAHALAHGFAQHGGADVYPVTRALADVIDVLPLGHRAAGLDAAPWVAAELPSAKLRVLLGLCDALEQGDLDSLDDECQALLQHVLASALDADYRRSMAIDHLWHAPSDEPRWWRFLKTVQCLAWPTKGQLAARLGLPSPSLVNGRLRVAHVTDLARRLPELLRAAAQAKRPRSPPPTTATTTGSNKKTP